MLKSKKGVTIVMIMEAMVVISAMFLMMTTFIVVYSVADKTKKAKAEFRTDCYAIYQDFYDTSEGYVDYLSQDQTQASLESIKSYYTSSDKFVEKYKDSGYSLVDTVNDDTSATYKLQNDAKKYIITVKLTKRTMAGINNVEKVTYISRVTVRKSYSTSTTTFIGQFEIDPTGPDMTLDIWNLRY